MIRQVKVATMGARANESHPGGTVEGRASCGMESGHTLQYRSCSIYPSDIQKSLASLLRGQWYVAPGCLGIKDWWGCMWLERHLCRDSKWFSVSLWRPWWGIWRWLSCSQDWQSVVEVWIHRGHSVTHSFPTFRSFPWLHTGPRWAATWTPGFAPLCSLCVLSLTWWIPAWSFTQSTWGICINLLLCFLSVRERCTSCF